jgi:hypothetical protein
MSNISNQHDITLFTGKNKPLAGQVLLSYTFKTVKDETSPLFGTKPDSKCVSVPVISNDDIIAQVDSFLPKLQDAIHDERRLILRDAAMAGKTSISTDELGIAAVLARWAADASSSGGRFSKAVVADWFASVLAPVLYTGIMSKNNIPVDTPEDSPLMVKVEKTLEMVLEAINTVLFSKKKPAKETLIAVTAIIAKLADTAETEADETHAMIVSKLASWENASNENLLDNLGF